MNRFLTVVNATVVLFKIVEPPDSSFMGMITMEALRQTKKGRTICLVHDSPINYPKMLSLVMRTVVVLVNGTMTQDVRESQASYTCELAKAAVSRWSGTRARMSNVFKIIAPFPKRGAIHVTCHETVKIPRPHRAPFY